MDAIFTSYYSTKPDPQRKKMISDNNFAYIKEFYDSVNLLKLNVRIFHDYLTSDFVEKYSTDHIQFVRVDLGKYKKQSLNDLRFLVYLDHIRQNNQYRKIFMTDISDVVVNMDPFTFVNDESLYIGLDRPRTLSHYFFKQTVVNAYNSYDKFMKIKDEIMLNAGIIGGCIETTTQFLCDLEKEFEVTNDEANANMAAVNYVARSGYIIITGFPLCSQFMKYEKRKDVYFTHK